MVRSQLKMKIHTCWWRFHHVKNLKNTWWKRLLWWECCFWTSAFLLWVQTCFLSVNYSSWCSTSIFSPYRKSFWFFLCAYKANVVSHGLDVWCELSLFKYVWPCWILHFRNPRFWRSTRQQSRAWGLYHWSCDPFEVGNPKCGHQEGGFLGKCQKQPGFKKLENGKAVSQVYDVLKKIVDWSSTSGWILVGQSQCWCLFFIFPAGILFFWEEILLGPMPGSKQTGKVVGGGLVVCVDEPRWEIGTARFESVPYFRRGAIFIYIYIICDLWLVA